jgi:hypothetical protein
MACTAICANHLLCDREILVIAVGVGALHAHVTSGPVDIIYGIKHLLLTDDLSSQKHLLITILILLQLHATKNNLGSSIDIQVKGLVLLNPLVACLVGLLEESESFLFLLSERIVLFPVTIITPDTNNIPDAINLTIGDSQLCFLRFDSMKSTMCLLDGGTHFHQEAHRILQ